MLAVLLLHGDVPSATPCGVYIYQAIVVGYGSSSVKVYLCFLPVIATVPLCLVIVVPRLFFIQCLGQAVLRDYGLFWVTYLYSYHLGGSFPRTIIPIKYHTLFSGKNSSKLSANI